MMQLWDFAPIYMKISCYAVFFFAGTQSTSPLPTVLTHRDLMNEVGAVIPAKWRFVGNELELQHDQLDAIEREQNGTL